MSVNNNICALLATSIVACTAGAGVLTMTANNPVGSDAWSGLSGYRMELTIDCSTLNDAGSSATFTLAAWNFKAFDNAGTMVFHASGTDKDFTASGGPSKFNAVIGLSNDNIFKNDLAPVAQSIAFSYAYEVGQSLDQAIWASANTTDGELTLGTDLNPTGILAGPYAVPAPGAAALLGLAGVMSRRRRA
jgi:hypothetical protein